MAWNPVTFFYNTFTPQQVYSKSRTVGYEAKDLVDMLESTYWKGSCTSDSIYPYAAEELTFDAGDHSKTFDYFVLGDHNLKSVPFMNIAITHANSITFIHSISYVGSIAYELFATAQYNGELYSIAFAAYYHMKYNPTANVWTAVYTSPTGCPRDHQTYINIGQYNYLFGGGPQNSLSNDLWRYNIVNNTWTQLASMSSTYSLGRQYHTACEFKGNMYVYGGMNAANSACCDMWKYDVAGNEWTQLGCNGLPRLFGQLIPYSDYIYMHGGYTVVSYMPDTWKYNPQDNTWTQCACSPIAHYAVNIWVMSYEIYFLGGANGSNENNIYKYNPERDSWSFVNSIQYYPARQGRSNTGYIGDRVYSVSSLTIALQMPFYPTLTQPTLVFSSQEIMFGEFALNSGSTTDVISFSAVSSKRYWQFSVVMPSSYCYVSNAWFGKKAEIGYATINADPYGEQVYANVNVGQTGIIQGIHEYFKERQFELKFENLDETAYSKLLDWRTKSGINNFFINWHTEIDSSGLSGFLSSNVWMVYPDSKFKADMIAGGALRNIEISLRGRKS